MISSEWAPVDDQRLGLGEGARFLQDGLPGQAAGTAEGDGPDAPSVHHFILVDILDGDFYSTTAEPGSGLTRRAHLDEPLGALAPLGGGDRPAQSSGGRSAARAEGESQTGWVAAVGEGLVILDQTPSGELVITELLGKPAAGRAQVPLRMNDAVADPHGRFWAGAMTYDGDPGEGIVLRLDPDGSIHIVLEGLAIPNGPAFTADGDTMYLSETTTGWIRRFPVDVSSGDLGPGEDFVHVSEGGPDGMTVDAEGCLWSAVWGASCLHRYSPAGELLERIPVPVRQPTSIAISSVAPYRVMVTSATQHLDSPTRHDGRVITAEVNVAGRAAVSYTRRHA
ncbi:SMP-30/gluconolactonase/LRE family protein [Nesterenkonia lutea]